MLTPLERKTRPHRREGDYLLATKVRSRGVVARGDSDVYGIFRTLRIVTGTFYYTQVFIGIIPLYIVLLMTMFLACKTNLRIWPSFPRAVLFDELKHCGIHFYQETNDTQLTTRKS